MSQTQDIPVGLCQCGCGGKTNLAPKTNKRYGQVKGEPYRFIRGHSGRNLKPGPRYIEEDRGHDTPCWIWQLSTNSGGYARTGTHARKQYAHRVYYERANGPIPEGMQLDHLCRVRACVNPAHLEAVTQAENLRRGVGTKLNHEKVREIRASSASHAELSRRLGVCASTISRIRSGEYWRPACNRRKPKIAA